MTVREAIKKYGIKDSEMRIYVTSLNDEVYRPSEMKTYYDEEVITIYPHNRDVVLQVK